MYSRLVHLFCCRSVEMARLLSHSHIRDISRISSAFRVLDFTCTSPVVLHGCKRHASFNARINNHVYYLKHGPIYAISRTNQTLYPIRNQRTILCQRLFTSQHGSHKQTMSYSSSSWERANRRTVTYVTALAIAVVGLSYAAVPLYRIFCQASGYGGTVGVVDPSEKVESMEPIRERELTVR